MQKASMLYHKFKSVYLSGEDELSPDYISSLQQEREREESGWGQRAESDGVGERRDGREERRVVERRGNEQSTGEKWSVPTLIHLPTP